MELLLPVIAALCGLAIAWFVRENRRNKLTVAAAALGLDMSEEGFFGSEHRLKGQYRGRAVNLRYWRQGSGKSSHPRCTVTLSGLHPRFSVAREGMLSGVLGDTQGDVQIGDAALDARAVLRGPEVLLRARLDAAARLTLLGLLRFRDVKSDYGELTYCSPKHPTTADEIRALLDPGCDLADALPPQDPTLEDLLKPACEDPESIVRLRCLLVILDGGDAALRARAAAVAAKGSTAEERAMSALLSEEPAAIARISEPAICALALLAPDRVVKVLERVRAEASLLDLARSGALEAKITAVQALGAVGTVRAVEPLLPLTEGLLNDSNLKRVARQAVQAIQARLGDVSAGSLSLVDRGAAAGGLTVSGEAGALSEVRRATARPTERSS